MASGGIKMSHYSEEREKDIEKRRKEQRERDAKKRKQSIYFYRLLHKNQL